jgi:hypothetical protein
MPARCDSRNAARNPLTSPPCISTRNSLRLPKASSVSTDPTMGSTARKNPPSSSAAPSFTFLLGRDILPEAHSAVSGSSDSFVPVTFAGMFQCWNRRDHEAHTQGYVLVRSKHALQGPVLQVSSSLERSAVATSLPTLCSASARLHACRAA